MSRILARRAREGNECRPRLPLFPFRPRRPAHSSSHPASKAAAEGYGTTAALNAAVTVVKRCANERVPAKSPPASWSLTSPTLMANT